jgi:hypothetical protein
MNKREVPIYYVAINPKDRKRRDSQAWSVLYGAKVAHKVSLKISKWVVPSRFLVVSPYGVMDESVMEKMRPNFRLNSQEILFTHNDKTFMDNTHLPFTFTGEDFNACNRYFKDIYSGCDIDKTFRDVFSPIKTDTYIKQDAGWFYKVDNWEDYQHFLRSQEAALIERPKYLVTHKWRGLIKDK